MSRGLCRARKESQRIQPRSYSQGSSVSLCLFSPSMFSLGFSEGGKESWPGVCCVQVDSAQSGLVGLLGASPPTWGSVFFPGERGSFQLSVNPWSLCHWGAACSSPPKTEILGCGETEAGPGVGRCQGLRRGPGVSGPMALSHRAVPLCSPSASPPGAAGLSLSSKVVLGSAGSALASFMV